MFQAFKCKKKVREMSKEIKRIKADSEQRKKIMDAFGCTSQHLSNVLYFRRNSKRDERIRTFARQLGAKMEVLKVEQAE